LARVLAINGIKVLVIGLDIQGSITHNLRVEEPEIDSIEFIKNIDGLYEGIQKNDIESVVKQTDIPTLDYIPENTSLNLLEQSIRDKTKREHFFIRHIKPLQKKYEVIIFDNSPNWNFLIQNSLVAATDVISPVACDIETFRSLAQNIEMISDFKKTMELDWNNFMLVPTKLERTKLSTQIEAQYRTMFPQLMSYGSIRSAVKGQESSLEKMSILEYDCTSVLALDYYEVLIDLWNKINK
jgi:chromosome partitioning protein